MGNQVVKELRSFPAWLRYGVILVLILGIFFRFYNIDKKAYWIDETNSSLRTLGYTKDEVIQEVFTGEVVSVETLQQYQQLSPDRDWGDTMNSLMGTAEHAPLYFMLSRLWIGVVGHSVATMRFLAVIFSVLALPCLFWLCRELFESPAVAWIALALVSISPLHVLYAQEARPYSLWTVMILLSSAVLLRTLRTGKRSGWVAYGATVALGLYTQLLFGLVAIAHGLYVGLLEKWRLTRTTIAYSLASGIGLLAFTPWIALFFRNLDEVQQSTRTLGEGYPLSHMINRWFLNANLAFIDHELGSANILIVLMCAFAVYYLYRHAPKRSWLFIVLLISVSFLGLALPDLILEGRRSIRIRYLFPLFLGVEIALAYSFAMLAVWARTWPQKLWRFVLIFLIFGGIAACTVSSQAIVWWNKSVPRSSAYPVIASIVNPTKDTGLVLSDGSPTDTLALSYWLDPEVNMMLSLNPRKFKFKQIERYNPVFLINPEEQTKKVLNRRGYDLTLLYADRTDPTEVEERVWLLKKR